VEDYIRGLADEDLKKEIRRRDDEKQRAAHERLVQESKARQAIRDAARQEFCFEQGISLEQFDAVEGYLEDESEQW
jgi:hypothetical protein